MREDASMTRSCYLEIEQSSQYAIYVDNATPFHKQTTTYIFILAAQAADEPVATSPVLHLTSSCAGAQGQLSLAAAGGAAAAQQTAKIALALFLPQDFISR